jgi:ornithine carbamoyltransferase
MIKRDFLSLLDFSSDELKYVIERAKTLRQQHERGEVYQPLVGKTGALILTMSSTRTRVAFEAGFSQMGANVIFLSPGDTQIGRGEPLEDLARVLSEMVDIIMIRTHNQADIETLAHYATVPVINAMSSVLHPCQLLADIQAFEEHRGSIEGKTVTFLGDGYNMCHSYINAAKQWNFNLRFSCPDSHQPDADILANGEKVERVLDPEKRWKAHTWWSPMCGRPWVMRVKKATDGRFSSPIRSTSRCLIWQTPTPCSCTACRRTGAKKSARPCWMTRALWSFTRPAIVCTARKPWWNFCC